MVDPNEVRRNLSEWLENPTWAEYYNDAPSEKCRKYIAMDFYASETEDEEAFEAMDAMEQGLSREDLMYLMKNATGPDKARFAELLKK